jgi:hypothetical protein
MSKNKIELTPQIDVDADFVAMTKNIKMKIFQRLMELKLISQQNGFIYENRILNRLFVFILKHQHNRKPTN